VDSSMQKDQFGGNVIKLEFIIRIPDSSNYVNSFEKIGVYCSIHKRRQSKLLKCPKTGKRYHRNSEVILDLAIYGRENILRFAEKVGFTIARKQSELTQLIRRYERKLNLIFP